MQAPGGMRIYLQSLLSELGAQAPDHQFVLFTPAWADPILDTLPPNIEAVRLSGVPVKRPLRAIYQQTVLAAAIALRRLDVFFATATVAPLLIPVPIVLAVQFIQFYEMPEAYGRMQGSYLRNMLPLSLRKARKALIFTEYAKGELVRLTGVPPEKVCVVPHGLSWDIWRLAEAGGSAAERGVGKNLSGGRPYILYVASTYGYKNHSRLVRAFGLLKRRTNLPHVLLLVGAEVTVSFRELEGIADSAGVREDVIFAGRLDHRLAAATYLAADLAVIPTLYETFGFAALEAMACGCPVVTSGIGSMAELSGDAAVLVDPFDEHSIADGIERVLRDFSLRQELILRGRRRVKQYTWDRSAARTIEILREVAES